MPEGHTIHRIARDHGAVLTGRRVRVSSPQGRFATDAARVDGATLERIQPYGKHLFYEWSTGEIGHVHLGLFGKFRVQYADRPSDPIGQVRMRLLVEPDRDQDRKEWQQLVTVDLSGPTADGSVRRRRRRQRVSGRSALRHRHPPPAAWS